MITQARSIHQDKAFNYFIVNFNFKQKLFLVVLLVVKLRASPFVLIDPSTGRAVEQVGQIPPICETKNVPQNDIYCLPMPGEVLSILLCSHVPTGTGVTELWIKRRSQLTSR